MFDRYRLTDQSLMERLIIRCYSSSRRSPSVRTSTHRQAGQGGGGGNGGGGIIKVIKSSDGNEIKKCPAVVTGAYTAKIDDPPQSVACKTSKPDTKRIARGTPGTNRNMNGSMTNANRRRGGRKRKTAAVNNMRMILSDCLVFGLARAQHGLSAEKGSENSIFRSVNRILPACLPKGSGSDV
uniref:Uncharacterized protein n=1 Tax=Anopheles coluzzii TaxID=1518534 RepID=A0A8W7P7M5_ANOCL